MLQNHCYCRRTTSSDNQQQDAAMHNQLCISILGIFRATKTTTLISVKYLKHSNLQVTPPVGVVGISKRKTGENLLHIRMKNVKFAILFNQ